MASRKSLIVMLLGIFGLLTLTIASANAGNTQLWAIGKKGHSDCKIIGSATPPGDAFMKNHIYSAQKKGFDVQYYVCGGSCASYKRDAIHKYCRLYKRIPPASFNIRG
jgi:hypothetical protein